MIQHSPNCFMLLRHAMPWALVFALASAGKSKTARMAMMAITTRSSMRVNPQELLLKDSNGDWARRSVITMRLFRWNNAYSKKEGKATVRLRAQVSGSPWRSPSTLLHVVAEDQVLIAQIEFPVRDHGMGPETPLRIAYLRLRIELEPAMLFPRFRRRFRERYRTAVFVQAIQHPVRATDRTFAERVLF